MKNNTDNKLKIALLLTGGMRNFKDTFNSFKYYVLDELNPDIFFFGVENNEGVIKNTEDFNNLFKPKSSIINNKHFYDNITKPQTYIIPSSYYSFYNVYHCNKLRIKYQEDNNFKYDLVIRCRLDTFWFRKIDAEELNIAKENIIIPKEWCFKEVHQKALSDIFAIGNDEMMTEYSNLFNHIQTYCMNNSFHPETLMGIHCDNFNLKYYLTNRHFDFFYPTKTLEDLYVPKPYKFIEYFPIIGTGSLSEQCSYRKKYD
jgi:hypothetical protein